MFGVSRRTGFCLALFCGLAGQSMAQSPIMAPAETPPASYDEAQFVDSRGCVFVRARIDGDVVWAPRVSADRRQVCGYRPTFAPPPQQPIPSVAPAPAPTRAAPAPATVAVAAPPEPAPTQVVNRRSARPPQPKAQPIVIGRQATGPLTPNTRVIPRHVYEGRANAVNIPVPKGYRSVWQDDRLNPYRGVRTLAPAKTEPLKTPQGYRPALNDGRFNDKRGPRGDAGNAQMRQIWTDGVPRKLVRPTAKNPPRPEVSDIQRADTVISAKTRLPRDQWYVRVSSPQDPETAQRAAVTAQQASRAPARRAIGRNKGVTYPILLVGPFDAKPDARQAIKELQKAGFAQARLVK